MSESIKHECGIALIRLRKPFEYYLEKYQTPSYGLSKLYLMMEKQVNRGQDGAGIANIKIDVDPGKRYISRYRSVEDAPIQDIFGKINKKFRKAYKIIKETRQETGIDYSKDFGRTWHPLVDEHCYNFVLMDNFLVISSKEGSLKLVERIN